jgi:hypothetical protein
MTHSALVLCLALTSCATTSGRDWLNAPLEPQTSPPTDDVALGMAAPEARPRLNHTVTLGETYASAPAPAPPGGAAPATQVNVTTHVPVTINNWGGYGYGYGGVTASRASILTAPVRAAGSDQKVGADFPKVPDYGPRALK